MALDNMYDLDDLKNHAEQLVFQEIEKRLEMRTLPKLAYNQEIILDVAAYALNHVKPLYRATLLGRLFEHEQERLYRQDVEKAVTLAFEKILANPSV